MAGNILTKFFNNNKHESSYDGANYSAYTNPRSSRLTKLKPSRTKLIGLSVIVLAILGFAFWFKNASDKIAPSVAGESTSAEVAAPYAIKQIDREFSFPLRNEKGEQVSELKYIVQNAELTNEIIVKGQKASSIQGRTFLVLNLKINNDSKQKVQVQSRDYIRLIVGNNEAELLAPDIHNDPVEVQPISTKFTRLGFAINETDKNLKLQIGEIEGEKQIVEVLFD